VYGLVIDYTAIQAKLDTAVGAEQQGKTVRELRFTCYEFLLAFEATMH
jgi:hypothetical protein